MFVDSVTLEIRSGRGGDGIVSFRREKYVPKGGPDGGDGGDGGDVIIAADEAVETLEHLTGKEMLAAEDGGPGEGKKKSGANGKDIVLRVPVGTSVTDLDTGLVIKTLSEAGISACVAEGGRGGRGNTRFSTAEDQKPNRRKRGTDGRGRSLRLECSLSCDAAIVGPPNSGKSSLLALITSARPEIADYSFTTTNANIGEVILPDYTSLLAVDFPALVGKSHEGAGLGNAFLRHAQRAKVFVITIDGNKIDAARDVETVRRQIELYSEDLSRKPWIIVCMKTDIGRSAESSDLEERFGVPVAEVSAESNEGIDKLIELLVSYARASSPLGGED